MQTGSYECPLEKKDLTVYGRERSRKEDSVERTGHLWGLEVGVEGLWVPMKDPYRCSRTPGEDRVCLKVRRWQSVEEEEIAQG